MIDRKLKHWLTRTADWPAFLFVLVLVLAGAGSTQLIAADASQAALERRFNETIHPFITNYCVTCHSKERPRGDFDISGATGLNSIARDVEHWKLVVEKLQASDMPPAKAKLQPSAQDRKQVIDWVQALWTYEGKKNAGDPGMVLARRLSNSEYDYSIRDLTGQDMDETREFPVDPSNTAGFDNSGESLVMSPSLLKKYLKAARDVADHMVLKPSGFTFAPYPMIVETDRDKYCVGQIIDYYHQQNTNYADYFEAAWRFKNRAALGQPKATLADLAKEKKVSAKYLGTILALLDGPKAEVGPVMKIQSMWQQLPAPKGKQPDLARAGCQQMMTYVQNLRVKIEPRFLNIAAGKVATERQPLMMWKNVQYATHRMTYDTNQLQFNGVLVDPFKGIVEIGTGNQFGPGRTVLITNTPGDPDLFVPAGQEAQYEASFAKFCSVFPDMFYKQERGRNYFDTTKDRGRYLSAGFHNVMGYFRDDEPLYRLVLDDQQEKTLDEMWREMDFVASTTRRMYGQFASFGEAVGNLATNNEVGDAAPPEDKELSSEVKIKALEKKFLEQAQGGSEAGIQAIKDYFETANATVRWVEKTRVEAEPSHLESLMDFAARAYRRPLTKQDRDDLLAYYHAARDKDGMDHESAIRDTVVSVLMSPDFTYRIDMMQTDSGIHPLSDLDLASRLSYFLWSSLPDKELMDHAVAGDLHKPKVIAAQAQRMLKDPRIRGLAVEFGGNWLNFRRFETINTVDHDRFPTFNNALKEAMFEEPVRFLMDVFQNNRPVTDCLYAHDTFVNPVLAKHYGMPTTAKGSNEWVRVEDADKYDRGGLLPMAVFLTQNAPGLRTSPVKRGNWVVKNVLGEKIPPPPPVVPELPKDESKLDLPLREVLARHRSDPNCAACHARFDSLGLVFEGYGPTGERRENDLAGHPVDARAAFPNNAGEGAGLAGLEQYIREKRQNDFINNICGKMVAFALDRSMIFSDDLLVQDMRSKLAANGYRFDTMIESIVTSPQFLNKRGREDLAQR